MKIGPGLISDPNYFLSVARGNVKGVSAVRKYGKARLDTGGFRDVWFFGSDNRGNLDYVQPADGTAPITHLSSSDNTDAGVAILTGLDINGALTVQPATVAGNAKVALTTPLWRCHTTQFTKAATSYIIGSADAGGRLSGLQGDLYVYEDVVPVAGVPAAAAVRSYVERFHNRTLQAFYTVPLGTTAFVMWARNTINKKTAAAVEAEAWIRPYGGVPFIGDTGSVHTDGTGTYQECCFLQQPVPALTDIMIRAEPDSNDTSYGGRFDILLFEDGVL